MLKQSFLSLSIVLGLLLSGCSSDSNSKTEEVIQESEADAVNSILATNEFVLKSLSNQEYVIKKLNNGFALASNPDQIVIIDIFATWCPPCQAEASHLSNLQEKYKNELTILGVTIEDEITSEQLEEFRHQYAANYTLVHSSENRRLVNEVAKNLNVGRNFGIPLMAMYKNGQLINYYQGATEEEFIESDIKKALGK